MTVKEIRAATGMTQAAFAAVLRIPKRTVEDWETDKRTPAPYLLPMMEARLRELGYDVHTTTDTVIDRYVIVDDMTTAGALLSEEPLSTQDEAEAIEIAYRTWNALSEHDRRRRDDFFLAYGPWNEEDMVLDMDRASIIAQIK